MKVFQKWFKASINLSIFSLSSYYPKLLHVTEITQQWVTVGMRNRNPAIFPLFTWAFKSKESFREEVLLNASYLVIQDF